jgi:hypothetical protein
MKNYVHYSQRINRIVKTFCHNTIYLLIISFYLVTLFPLAKVTTKGDSGDLREAVHTLQVLQANTSESTQNFKKSLKYSIRTIQNLAGLQTIIFDNHTPLESKPQSLVTITFRFLYLPANNYSLPHFISLSTFSFPEYYHFYLSLNFAPETPPPVLV